MRHVERDGGALRRNPGPVSRDLRVGHGQLRGPRHHERAERFVSLLPPGLQRVSVGWRSPRRLRRRRDLEPTEHERRPERKLLRAGTRAARGCDPERGHDRPLRRRPHAHPPERHPDARLPAVRRRRGPEQHALLRLRRRDRVSRDAVLIAGSADRHATPIARRGCATAKGAIVTQRNRPSSL